MFLPGQKVVCVNDVFPDAIKKFYWKLPVKGVTYTVRDLIPGIDPSGEPGEMCVYLVELINPCSDTPPYPERGFKAERFRPLETDTETEFMTDDLPDEVPAEAAAFVAIRNRGRTERDRERFAWPCREWFPGCWRVVRYAKPHAVLPRNPNPHVKILCFQSAGSCP